MSGQHGGRGYAVQWIISGLDALETESWTHCTFEPNDKSEKVDVLFETRDANDNTVKSCAKQIKSSMHQFGLADARNVGEELKASYPAASEHEVILVGPAADGITTLTQPSGVVYRLKTLDIEGMYKQAAQSIGLFLERLKLTEPPARARGLIARGLSTRITEWSAAGRAVTRDEFTSEILRWIDGEILKLPNEYASVHDRTIIRMIHARLSPQFVRDFLEAAHSRRPDLQAALYIHEVLKHLRQQRFVPRDDELAEVVGRFLNDLARIDDYFGSYFSAEEGQLRYTPGRIDAARDYALKSEYERLDRAAQKSHNDLITITQARWPEVITEFNEQG